MYNFDINPHEPIEETLSGKIVDVRCDVTDYSAVSSAVEEIVKREGALDFLIKNAGITYKCRAEEYPEDRLDRILELNLKTPLMVSRIWYPSGKGVCTG